ncbi:hypothetical protein KR51_00018930, partial [Rubidibacter lacunae KORDI 51-2]
MSSVASGIPGSLTAIPFRERIDFDPAREQNVEGRPTTESALDSNLALHQF